MASDTSANVRIATLLVVGALLMLVAHLLAFAGSAASQGLAWRPPYWWGYLLAYPVAGAVAARLTRANWKEIAACLCIAPILYFLALGVVDSNWRASDGALLGAVLAFGLTAGVAFFARRRDPTVLLA